MDNRSPERATDSVAAVGNRYSPVTVAGRIARIDADLRWVHRRLRGSTRSAGYGPDGAPEIITVPPASGSYRMVLIEQRDRLLGELRHWRRVREWQIAAGRVREYGPATISPGDSVKIRGRWRRVVRTHNRTLKIERDDGRVKAVAYRMVQDHAPKDADGVG